MNCDANNQAIRNYLDNDWKDTYHEIHGTLTPGLTYHAFKGDNFDGDHITPPEINKMDWLLYIGAVDIKEARILKEAKDGKYPSDHYFVVTDVELAENELGRLSF